MHNLHCFYYILTPNIQFLPPKGIVAFRNSAKLCLFPFILQKGSTNRIINFVVVEKTVP